MPVHLPSVGRAARRCGSLAALGAALAGGAGAQARPPAPPAAAPADTARPRPPAGAPRDTAARRRGPRARAAGAQPRPGLRPPVTPRRALISSLLVPGLGQTRLGRPTAGAVFVAAELAAVAMISKTVGELRAARALRADTITTVIPLDPQGQPTGPVPRVQGPFTSDLVRARSLHVEDWIAVVLFNHLISGAEAFVSAQLYDLPAQVSARPGVRGGAVVAVSVAW